MLVVRSGAATFAAFSAVCTHQGCLVLMALARNFVCGCHGSRYGFDGQVVRGPATEALTVFPTEYVDGVLTITFLT